MPNDSSRPVWTFFEFHKLSAICKSLQPCKNLELTAEFKDFSLEVFCPNSVLSLQIFSFTGRLFSEMSFSHWVAMNRLTCQFQHLPAWIAPRLRSLVVCSAVMIIALSGLAERAVAGSCGHYLYRNGKPVHSESMNDSAQTPKENVFLTTVNHESAPAPKQPCKGPGCRSGSIPLGPVPVPISMSWSTELAVLLDELSASVSQDGVRVVHDSECATDNCVDDIFRPPTFA